MNKVYRFIQKLFTFSYHEARGFLWLFIISCILLSIIVFPELVFNRNVETDPSEVEYLDSLAALFSENQAHERFSFNPNTVSKDSLVLIGFPEDVANRLINYRSSGGSFKIKNDVRKVYGVTSQLMDRIYELINLPDSFAVSRNAFYDRKFDINSATPKQLMTIHQIGDVLAARIVKYRELLGGYVDKDQYGEVYGLSEVALQNLNSFTFIHSGFKPELLKINSATLESLKRHPYISAQLAEDIIRYREINVTIESEIVLANFKSIDKSNFKKLILYLDFQ